MPYELKVPECGTKTHIIRLKNKLKQQSIEDLLYRDKKCWYWFELLAAIWTQTVPWDDLSLKFKDSINFPRQDIGIDSFGNHTAVQTKYKFQKHTIDVKEINHFLMISLLKLKSMYDIDTCAIVIDKESNLTKLTFECMRLAEQHFGISTNIIKLEDNMINQIVEFVTGIPYQPIENTCQIEILRDYQEDAIKCIVESPKRSVRIKIPCGCGKTIVIFGCIGRYQSSQGKICIFVPSLLLLDHFIEYFEKYKIPTSYYCPVGTGYNDKINYDAKIFICVYNSIDKIKHLDFDIIFIDEGHHLYQPSIYKTFESIDEDELELVKDEIGSKKLSQEVFKMKYKKIVFLSATIDDPDFEYDMREAIEKDYICDYDLHIPVFENKRLTNEDIKSYLDDHPECQSILAYCNSIKRCDNITEYLLTQEIKATTFNANTSVKIRKQILNDFRLGNIRILITVNTLGEGIDIKNADTCFFIETRKSRINVMQCIGRIMRKHPSKTVGHVVIPSSLEYGDDDTTLKSFIRIICSEDSFYNSYIRKGDCHSRIHIQKTSNTDSIDPIPNSMLYERYIKKFVSMRIEAPNLVDEWKRLKKYVSTLKLKHKKEYRILCESNDKLVYNPDEIYHKYWNNWYDFLNIDTSNFIQTKTKWKDKCQILGIMNYDQYCSIVPLYPTLPAMPEEVYRNFTNFTDEFGISEDYLFI
jgi:superfamily II DNA or RNA helicase